MSVNSQHVLFVASWYPNTNKPFLGNFIQRHAEALVSAGQTVEVFHIDKSYGNQWEVETKTEGGITSTIIYLPAGKTKWGKLASVPYRLKAYKILSKLYEKADVVHVHVLRDVAMMCAKLQKKWNKKLFITEHSTYYLGDNFQQPKLTTWNAMKYLCNHANKVLPVTQHLGKAMQSRGLKGKYDVLENVVNTELFQISRENSQENYQFIHVSTLLPNHKNPEGMLRAFSEAVMQNPNLHFKLISDEDTTAVKQQIQTLGLEDKTTILGPCTIEEVAEHVAQANAQVLFSNYENFPCVIPESWASGIPVISTRVGGIDEHLNDSNGKIIDKGDEKALTQAMLQFAQNPAQFQSEELRNYAKNHFSYEAIGKKMLGFYRLS